jgi:hypothetical protein
MKNRAKEIKSGLFQSGIKKAYLTPIAIKLGSLNGGLGNCEDGSGAQTGRCNPGNSNVANCETGNVASGNCEGMGNKRLCNL